MAKENYIQIGVTAKLTVAFHTDDPFIGEATPQYGNNWGVLYSTTPNVTIETGELIQMADNRISAVTNLANASFDAVLGNSAIFEEIKNSYPVDLEFLAFSAPAPQGCRAACASPVIFGFLPSRNHASF